MLKMPAGKPASIASSASRTMLNGVISDGFSTMLLPAAMAGAIFHAAMTSGRFHGAIAATTP